MGSFWSLYLLLAILGGFVYAAIRANNKPDMNFINFLWVPVDTLLFPILAPYREYKRGKKML